MYQPVKPVMEQANNSHKNQMKIERTTNTIMTTVPHPILGPNRTANEYTPQELFEYRLQQEIEDQLRRGRPTRTTSPFLHTGHRVYSAKSSAIRRKNMGEA